LTSRHGLHTKPDDGEDSAGEDNEVAEVVSKRHASEDREGSMQSGSYASIDGDDNAHDKIAEHAGPDGHFPIQTDGNH
jgi:hypothetical protein